MSNLYDLFGQEETEPKPRNNQKWQAEQKANREYCYAQIEKSGAISGVFECSGQF